MRYAFANLGAMAPSFWRWPHINPAHEWADHVDGSIVVETDFLDRFERLRAALGYALPINSGYRTPAHNRAVSTTGDNGPHTTGRACDIRIYGARALDLITAARALGFTGFGVQQKETVPLLERYVHVDDLTAPAYPRPGLWSY